MTIDENIKDEKPQYDINREAAKISASTAGKINQYKYLTGKDILPSDKSRIIEKVKGATKPYFTDYSSVVIILFKRVYVGLHFLPIFLQNQFFVFLCFFFLF